MTLTFFIIFNFTELGASALVTRNSVQRTFSFLYMIWPFDLILLLSSVLGNCGSAKARKLYRLLIFTTVLLWLVGLPMNWIRKFHSLEHLEASAFLVVRTPGKLKQ